MKSMNSVGEVTVLPPFADFMAPPAEGCSQGI